MARYFLTGLIAAAISTTGGAIFALHTEQSVNPEHVHPRGKQVDRVTLTHLGQQPEEQHPWGGIHWLMNNQIDPEAQQTLGVVRINPGKSNALHLHPNCEELMYILSGTGSTTVGKKIITLHPGDLVRVPAGVLHQATAFGSAPLVAVISYSSANRQVVNHGPEQE
jgi:mannose-6-phosphate isomerase-like protein (cupin superfamily)